MPPVDQTLRTVQAIVGEFLAETGGTQPEAIHPESRLTDFAASSVHLLQIHARLEEALGLTITASALFEYETLAELADYLAGSR